MLPQIQVDQAEEIMRLPIRAIKTGVSVLVSIILVSCVSAQSPASNGIGPSEIDIREVEIAGLHAAVPEGEEVILRAKIDETEYGTLALFPKGKTVGDEDAGKCIDLVYPRTMRKAIAPKSSTPKLLRGHFVYLNALPDYTMSLDIEGVSHKPVCQIFSNIERYPYFFVESVS